MKPEIEAALVEIERRLLWPCPAGRIVRAELERLEQLINTPETQVFLEGVKLEAAHQTERWNENDAKKEPSDWFWTLGYLGGKAMNSQIRGDLPKAMHHVIAAAAMCAQWHSHLIGMVRPPLVEPPLRTGDGIDHNLGGHGITTPPPAFPPSTNW